MDRHAPDSTPGRIQVLASQGGRIGLLGGSFNPAHTAHVHISLVAMRRLGLDAVWWLVSPQNPLKPSAGMAPLRKRIDHARLIAQHPRLFVSAVERQLNTRYTIDTVTALQGLFPRARFVWLMGGDSLSAFHHWRRWTELFSSIPIGVVARPGFTVRAMNSPAAQRFRQCFVSNPTRLATATAPAWTFILEPLDPTSATEIRAQGNWL